MRIKRTSHRCFSRDERIAGSRQNKPPPKPLNQSLILPISRKNSAHFLSPPTKNWCSPNVFMQLHKVIPSLLPTSPWSFAPLPIKSAQISPKDSSNINLLRDCESISKFLSQVTLPKPIPGVN